MHHRYAPSRAAFVPVLTLSMALAGLPFVPLGAAAPSPLDAAIDGTTRWLRAAGRPSPAGLEWPADPNDPASVGTSLYSGSPGVVLFLLERHHQTKDAQALADARRGADRLIAAIDTTSEPGLYTGLAGIGFTFGEVHRATGDAKYRDAARRVVARLATLAKPAGRGVEWSEVTDIVGGAAGTGLYLLHAARTLGAADARALAVRAGDRLIELGQAEAGGLKWAMSPSFPRLMPNFSHGTAGIAYFLADLYRETREPRFLEAALAGARYLKSIASTDGDMCLIFHHEPGDDGKKLYYLGWCHGPAGTARLWYRLYQVTQDKAWLDWAERSARGILTSGIPERQTPGFWNNVSQCCGSAGVAAFFLELHRVTGNPTYLTFSKRVTDHLLADATTDATGTRWVQAENRVSPDKVVAQTGWMQGASGIGAWLLQYRGFEQGRKPFVTLPDNPF